MKCMYSPWTANRHVLRWQMLEINQMFFTWCFYIEKKRYGTNMIFIISSFNVFLFRLTLLYYLLCIQYNILFLIRNATSNNHYFHSDSMLKDYDFNIKSNYSYNIYKIITHNPIFSNPRYYKPQITPWIWDQIFVKGNNMKTI